MDQANMLAALDGFRQVIADALKEQELPDTPTNRLAIMREVRQGFEEMDIHELVKRISLAVVDYEIEQQESAERLLKP